jgi:hypothetical protein
MTQAAHLTHEEAVELLPVLVARLAAAHDIRTLLIKGRVADFHRLRPPQLSADVDVLVAPDGFDELHRALIDAGWIALEEDAQPQIAQVKHSVTLRHPLWPIELDLHRHFPGVFAREADAFQALWDDRVHLESAGRQVPATGRAGSFVIGLLHAWRNPGDPKADAEEASMAVALSNSDEAFRATLSDLVVRTGTGEAGRERWIELGIDPGPATDADPEALLTWRISSDAGRTPLALGWIFELRRQPLRRRPGILLRALLGADEHNLRSRYPTAPAGRRGLWVIRWWRLNTAVTDVPRIVSLWRRHRQR